MNMERRGEEVGNYVWCLCNVEANSSEIEGGKIG